MKLLKCTTLTVCLALTACGSQIDDRQTEVNQGLVYKHGDTDPYTGTVIHSKLRVFDSSEVGDCSIEYRKGLVDGKTLCDAANGEKIFEAHTADEKRTGVEKHWNPQNGELVYEVHWSDNKKDGVEKGYDASGKVLLQEIHWSNGDKDGQQRVWDETGKLLTDLDWKDGKSSGVYREINNGSTREVHFKNGLLDGTNRVLDTGGAVIEETPFEANTLNGTQTFYHFGEPEVVRHWKAGAMTSESVRRQASKTTIYEMDEVTCNPDCPAIILEGSAYPRAIDLSTATIRQTQWPKLQTAANTSAGPGNERDLPDQALLQEDGYRLLDILNVEKPIPRTLNPDQSKIDKLETTFKGLKADGVQRAWDAKGAVILEVGWQQGQSITATGSLLALASEPTTVAPTALTTGTRAGNPSTTQIVIFQFDGANGPEPAFCEDDGQDGVMCRSDSTTEIGAGTYQQFMIPGSKICIAGTAGCVLPKSFDPAVVKG